jgi:histidine triad (HIT) family protein
VSDREGAADDFYCREVLSGETPVEVVAETPHVLAFRHTRPHYDVHVVVVPKEHIASLLELPAGGALAAELWSVVQEVAAEIIREHGGCHVVTNLGRYQDSKHLHVHVGVDPDDPGE